MSLSNEIIFGQLSTADVFGLAASLVRKHFRPMLGLIIGPLLIAAVTVIAYFALAFPNLYQTQHSGNVRAQVVEVLVGVVGGLALAIPIISVCLAYAGGIISQVMLNSLQDRPVNFREIDAQVTSKIGRLMSTLMLSLAPSALYLIVALGLSFGPGAVAGDSNELTGISIIGLFMLFLGIIVVPMMIGVHGMAVPVLLNEDVTIRQALKRSRELMGSKKNGRFGSQVMSNLWAAGLLDAFAAIVGTSILISMVGMDEWFRPMRENDWLQPITAYASVLIPLCLGAVFFVLLWYSVTATLYVERRMRLEGLDIDILRERMEREKGRSRFAL